MTDVNLRAQRRQRTRGGRDLGEVGTVEEYISFFGQHPLAEHHRAMLTAHAASPGQIMTATQLAAAAGWQGKSALRGQPTPRNPWAPDRRVSATPLADALEWNTGVHIRNRR